MSDALQYIFRGSDPNLWFASKFLVAFLGGMATWLFQRKFFASTGQTKVKFWRGVCFSFFSAVGGLTLIAPPDAAHCFAAGIIGMTAIASTMRQGNEGASDKRYKNKALTAKEVKKLAEGEIDE